MLPPSSLPNSHIAGLRHEAVDHAVEHHAIILTLSRQRCDLLHMLGGDIVQQVDGDGAVGLACDLDLQTCGQRGAGHQGKDGCQLTHLPRP